MAISPFLQKLLFVNQFSIDKGEISLLGDPHIMLNAESIAVLQSIDKEKTYSEAKKSSKANLSKFVGHAEVYKGLKDQELKTIAELSKKIGKTDEGTIKTLQTIFEIYGLGTLQIIDLNNKDKKAVLRISNSTLAKMQLKKAKSKTPVCSLTAGILAGIFSYIFGKDVDCVEKSCIAKNDEYCNFEIA